MGKRDELAEQATDYALEHGLIGLSLRPLAAELGTSDRMLIYHFGNRDGLVAAIIDEATTRSVDYLRDLPATRTVRSGVLRLWQAYLEQPLHACNLIYVQAAASGYLGQEPYRSSVRDSNARWEAAMREWFQRCGAPRQRVDRIAQLVESALLGFHVDLSTDTPDELTRGVRDLADAAHALAG
jgi:AcrR family transcriptional regulator